MTPNDPPNRSTSDGSKLRAGLARGAQVQAYAARHALPVLAIDDLVRWERSGRGPV